MAHLANNETASRPRDERQSPSWYHPHAPARYADLSGPGLKEEIRNPARHVDPTSPPTVPSRLRGPDSSACGSEAMFGSRLPPASTILRLARPRLAGQGRASSLLPLHHRQYVVSYGAPEVLSRQRLRSHHPEDVSRAASGPRRINPALRAPQSEWSRPPWKIRRSALYKAHVRNSAVTEKGGRAS